MAEIFKVEEDGPRTASGDAFAADEKGPVLVICGVVDSNLDLDEIDDRDEMWAAHLVVNEHIAFVNEHNQHFSPEDFLENVDDIQDKSNWVRKCVTRVN